MHVLRRRSLGQCSWVNVWLSIMWVGVRAYGYRWTCLVPVTRRVLHALVSFPRAFCFRMQCSCDVQRRVLPNAYDYVVLWPLGPAFSESGHAFSLIKCYSRELKMKPRVVDYFGNLRRLLWSDSKVRCTGWGHVYLQLCIFGVSSVFLLNIVFKLT